MAIAMRTVIISLGCHGYELIQSQQPIIIAQLANLQSLIAWMPSLYALQRNALLAKLI